MSRSLWSAFAADRVDRSELQNLIARHFPSGAQPRRREIVYPGDRDEDYAIKLVFNRRDRLCAIEAGPLLTPELERRLCQHIADALLTVSEPRVSRRVLFAHHKLSGYWRYKDRFQVLPVPHDAPQINAVYGDHPFMLEIRAPGSTDSAIAHLRAHRALRETELLLAGLVNSSIHPLQKRTLSGTWVHPPGADQCTYLYSQYDISLPQDVTAFSRAGADAPIVSPWELFGPLGPVGGRPLSFPEGLADLLSLYHELPPSRRDQVLRASYWIQLANRMFMYSFSAAYMAIITAAEVLFPGRKPEICKECRQPRYGLRQAFATFLQSHVPLEYLTSSGYHDVPSFLARLKYLYDTRSELTHGTSLRGSESPTSGFTPQTNTDDNDLRTLLRIMHFALGAWIVNVAA